MNEELMISCMQIITYVGTARSCYINAIQCAKEGNFEEADKLIKEGEEISLRDMMVTAICLQRKQGESWAEQA